MVGTGAIVPLARRCQLSAESGANQNTKSQPSRPERRPTRTNNRPREDNVGFNYRDVDHSENPGAAVRWLDELGSWPFYEAYKRRSIELLDLHPGERALDVGCGTGDVVVSIAQITGTPGCAVGLDSSETMIDEARRRTRELGLPVEVVVGDAHSLPFEDGSFDACRADRVLQHLERPLEALGEMVRVTRSGGRVLVVDPDYETLVIDVPERAISRKIEAYRRDHELRNGALAHRMPRLLREAGMENVRVEAAVLILHDPDRAFGVADWARRAQRRGLLTIEEVTAWEASFARVVEEGNFLFAVTFFTTVGCKV